MHYLFSKDDNEKCFQVKKCIPGLCTFVHKWECTGLYILKSCKGTHTSNLCLLEPLWFVEISSSLFCLWIWLKSVSKYYCHTNKVTMKNNIAVSWGKTILIWRNITTFKIWENENFTSLTFVRSIFDTPKWAVNSLNSWREQIDSKKKQSY